MTPWRSTEEKVELGFAVVLVAAATGLALALGLVPSSPWAQ